MDKLLEAYNFPKTSNENWIINLKTLQKCPGWDIYTGEFHRTFQELKPILLELFRTQKRREYFQTHFMSPALAWYQNQTSIPQEKKITG